MGHLRIGTLPVRQNWTIPDWQIRTPPDQKNSDPSGMVEMDPPGLGRKKMYPPSWRNGTFLDWDPSGFKLNRICSVVLELLIETCFG